MTAPTAIDTDDRSGQSDRLIRIAQEMFGGEVRVVQDEWRGDVPVAFTLDYGRARGSWRADHSKVFRRRVEEHIMGRLGFLAAMKGSAYWHRGSRLVTFRAESLAPALDGIRAKLRQLSDLIVVADESLEARDSLEELACLSDLVPELCARRDQLMVELSRAGLDGRVPRAARMDTKPISPDRIRNWGLEPEDEQTG